MEMRLIGPPPPDTILTDKRSIEGFKHPATSETGSVMALIGLS